MLYLEAFERRLRKLSGYGGGGVAHSHCFRGVEDQSQFVGGICSAIYSGRSLCFLKMQVN